METRPQEHSARVNPVNNKVGQMKEIIPWKET
jgi:hypothetical protein